MGARVVYEYVIAYEHMCCVYAMVFPDTPAIYIGSTLNLQERMRYHEHSLQNGMHHNPRVQAAYDHGKFYVVVLKECSPRTVRFIEEMLISVYFGSLLNISRKTNGFHEGLTHTPEVKEKLSHLLKDRIASGDFIQFDHTGRKHSEETKRRMSAATKGKPKSAEHRRKIGEVQIGRVHSAERCKQQSQTMKEVWARRKAAKLAEAS